VLDHIKTPRKHQYEDIPAAIARDAIIEQEIAEQQPMHTDNLPVDKAKEEPAQADDSEPVPQLNDVPEDISSKSLKKARKKKQSLPAAWEAPAKEEEAGGETASTETKDLSSSRDFEGTPMRDNPIIHEAIKDDMRDTYGERESRSLSSSLAPCLSDGKKSTQSELEKEISQLGVREHEGSVKDQHRHQEIYLPPSSTISQIAEDGSVQQRGLDDASPQPSSEGRAKDEHRRQEVYLPPSSTTPQVTREESVRQRGLDAASSQPLNENRVKDKHRRQESYLPPPPTLPVVMEEESVP
jgi:hypothetical protein